MRDFFLHMPGPLTRFSEEQRKAASIPLLSKKVTYNILRVLYPPIATTHCFKKIKRFSLRRRTQTEICYCVLEMDLKGYPPIPVVVRLPSRFPP